MSAATGIKVLELAESPGGEYGGKLLADFGADVIKIERPGCGSPTRSIGPFAGSKPHIERSGLFAYLNTNKRSLVLDVSRAEDLATLQQLFAQVDVVIDDHDAAWLARVGLDAATVERRYPHLIVCSVTNFGLNPADDRLHSEDINVFQSSGWGYHSPTNADPALPPLKAPRFLPSYEGGLEAALCIAAALFDKGNDDKRNDHKHGDDQRNGDKNADAARGRFIEVSKQEVMASRVDYVLAQMIAGDMDASLERSAFDLGGPSGIFACLDGHLYMWLSAPSHWQGLRELLDDTAWMDEFPAHWMERDCTRERVATCKNHIAAWLKSQHKHEVAARAQALGVTLVAVNNPRDLLDSPQYQFRRFFTQLDHPVLGAAIYPTVPYQLSRTPAQLKTAAPLLGQHTEECLREFSAASAKYSSSSSLPRDARRGPLAGLRVVELTKVWAGPYVGKLLAFLGAEVIRVESEDSLDVTRTYGVSDIDKAPGFKSVNPQKLGVQINTKTEKGVQLLLDLIGKSDIFVENLRPGAIGRMELGYERAKAANPKIIYVSMGMFGNEGPLAYQTGYAPCFAALGGITALVGHSVDTPAGLNQRYSDSTFGAAATFAALMALLHRQRAGVGQFIDVSAVECMTSMIGDAVMNYTLNGVTEHSDGNRHPDMAPHGIYPCFGEERAGEAGAGEDGHRDWICIAITNDENWRKLAQTMQRPELAEKYSTLPARKTHEDELDNIVAQWTADKDAVELAHALQAIGIAATKSQNSVDMIADHHLWSRDFYHEITESDGSTRPILGPGWKMSRGAEITRGAPRLGEHNAYVFGEVLGLSNEVQAELSAAGVTK